MASKNYPIEIIIEILILLPIKTLSRFKCVSKSWKNLIESPEFFKLHLKKSLKIDSYNCSLILPINRTHTITIKGSPIIIRTLYRAYLDLNDIKLRINKLALPSAFETSPESIKKFRNMYRKDTEKIVYGKNRIAGSCNGLVLILSGEHHIAVCNPSIEQHNSSFKIIPCFNYRGHENDYQTYRVYYGNQNYPRSVRRRFDFRVFGFGYDSYSHCYKIVSFTAKRALIYSLMKDGHSWREIDLPVLLYYSHNFTSESDQHPLIKSA